MSKQIYISADYDRSDGDQAVVNELVKWGQDKLHKVDFVDMSNPSSGSVAKSDDCRICDLKAEFNRQINASSAVIFVIGDMTRSRTAGNGCERASKPQRLCSCTPYKQNVNVTKPCKVTVTFFSVNDDDFGNINNYSYLRHEYEQAKKKKKLSLSSIIQHEKNKAANGCPGICLNFENYHSEKDVCISILGAGTTDFDGGSGTSIPKQDLLDRIVWSYRLSSRKIKSPYNLRIICTRSSHFSINKILSQ